MKKLIFLSALLVNIGPTLAQDTAAEKKISTTAALTSQQVEAFNKEFKRGRKLSGQKKWAEAVRAFEAALAIHAGEQAALIDLGFAAFQAGNFPKARAANDRALLITTNPEQRAAVLYNQGRVSEARGDRTSAQRLYSESLALRPNPMVQERLAQLGKPVEVRPLDCQDADVIVMTTPAVPKEFCERYRLALEQSGNAHPDEPYECELSRDEKLPKNYQLASVKPGDGIDYVLLVQEDASKLRPVGVLDKSIIPNGGGNFDEWSISRVMHGTVKTRPYVWIESKSSHREFEYSSGMNDDTDTDDVFLLFPDKARFCFPIRIVDKSTIEKGFEPNDPQAPRHPHRKETVMRATLDKDGRLDIRLVKGQASDDKGLLGEHQLPLD